MQEIKKKILFELKKELSENKSDGVVEGIRDSIPAKVAGSVKDMVTRDASKNQAPPPKETELLQKRFEPFQYPVSLMIGKFKIYKKEAEEAAKKVEGEDPKNKAQLERKAEIYGKITDEILTPLSVYIDKAAKADDFNAFNELTRETLGTNKKIPVEIDRINSDYGLSIPPMRVKIDHEGGASTIQSTGAAAKLANKYDQEKRYTDKNAALNEDVENQKAYLDLIIKQLRELLRPLALLVQKKGKESRTKITQTDLVQALDAKGIKENRNEIIELIVQLSQAKDGDFDIQEFLKDPIGQSKKWLRPPAPPKRDDTLPLEETTSSPSAEDLKKSLALKIAMAYYDKKLEPIVTNLPQDIAKDSEKLTTIKQELAKAFITGANTKESLEIEITADETMKFNWTGTTFERKIEGWERFLKTKGMEGFSKIEEFAKFAQQIVADKKVEDFIKDPEPWMKSVARGFYTDTKFNPGNYTVQYKLSESEGSDALLKTDTSGETQIIKTILYFFAAHKYSKFLKPLILKLNKSDEDLDPDKLKKIILPNVLLSYLKEELKDFTITVDEKAYNFTYTPAGKITVKGFRELEDWERELLDNIEENEKVFNSLFNLIWKTNKGDKHMLHKLLNAREVQPKDLELNFDGKKDIIGPYYYLYNLAVILDSQEKIRDRIIEANPKTSVNFTNQFKKTIDTFLREFFEFSSNPSIYPKDDQELYKKSVGFINSELKAYWNKKLSKPEESEEQMSEALNRKLKLFINKFINNRKQKWQRKTM